MKKKDTGSFDFSFENEAEVMMVKWNDNSIVTVATNNGTVQPLASAKRYNRKEKRSVSVPQPRVISEYNKNMGGVDLHDNDIANYRIRVRGKKWWWPLFTNVIDSAVVNSWKVHRLANENTMSHLEFRSYLCMALMKSEGSESRDAEENSDREDSRNGTQENSNKGRPSKNALPEEIRFDRVGHVIREDSEKARRRCRLCKSNTIYKCEKYNVHLHTNCFHAFHSR